MSSTRSSSRTSKNTTKPRIAARSAKQSVRQQKLFTVSLLRKNDLKDFGDLSQSKKEKVLSTLDYIDMLGSTTGTNLEHLDVFQIFGDGSPDIVTSKKEINQRFFAFVAQPPQPQVEAETSLTDDVVRRINEMSISSVSNELNRLKDSHREWLSRARERQQSVEEAITEAYKLRMQLDSFKPSTGTVGSQILEVVKGGFWSFDSMRGSKLTLNTNANVTLSLKQDHVDFGRFQVVLDVAEMTVNVVPYKDNIICDDHYHPHISEYGSVCWGNASDAAQKYLEAGKVKELLQLTAALLTTYNDKAPYVDLHVFACRSRKMSLKVALNVKRSMHLP